MIKLVAGLVVLGFVFFAMLICAGMIVENVDATEIAIIQSPVRGTLTCYTTQGWKPQWFGKVTSYPKRSQYEFETQVRFNDGGHGTMKGSVQYEMPLDCASLTVLHQQFGSSDAIARQLIQKVVNKSVYMTGPLMSSKESYAEKRNYLINYVEDQIANGVYQTLQREAKVVDPLTGQEKTAIQVEIVMQNGQPRRQEQSVLAHYGIKTSNFAINALPYDDQVEKQIAQQQQIAMDVQTAIAEARKAEQRKITVEQQGAADAAKAKWDQEVVKAKEVTAAQQRLEVAKLDNDRAEQYRQMKLKEADADATYRRRLMEADGALEKKLEAWLSAQQYWADAVKGHQGPWVPNTVIGTTNNGNGASTLIDLLTAKTAQDLGLDMTPGRK